MTIFESLCILGGIAMFVVALVGALALARISAIADTYTLHHGKPPEEWR